MRIQPRKQILDIWRHMLDDCYREGKWDWGGRAGSNAISDAEQLLCLFYPITRIDTFAVYDPDAAPADVVDALRRLGESTRIPRALVDVALGYFQNHTDDTGEPRFGAGSYLRAVDPDALPPTDQPAQDLEVVDAYSMSITLCLSLLVFVNARSKLETQGKQLEKLADLRERASRRLTAAMVGMLRSFVVNSVSVGSKDGQAILEMLRQGDTTDAELAQGLSARFDRLRGQLQTDVRLGVPDDAKCAGAGPRTRSIRR